MPLYEYQCDVCGVRFERRQHVSEESVSECPECGCEVRRLIQPVGIIFKGSGFYVTDNRSKSANSRITSDTKPSETSSKSESATESTASGDSGKSDSKSDKSTKD